MSDDTVGRSNANCSQAGLRFTSRARIYYVYNTYFNPKPPVSVTASSSFPRIVSYESYGGSMIWLKHIAAYEHARAGPA